VIAATRPPRSAAKTPPPSERSHNNARVHDEDRRTYGDEQHRLHLLADAGWDVRTVVAADLKDPQRTAALLYWLRTHLA